MGARQRETVSEMEWEWPLHFFLPPFSQILIPLRAEFHRAVGEGHQPSSYHEETLALLVLQLKIIIPLQPVWAAVSIPVTGWREPLRAVGDHRRESTLEAQPARPPV